MNALLPEAKKAAAHRLGHWGFALTPRALILLFAGLVWVFLAFFSKTFLFALVVWDGLVLLLAVADGAQLPRADRISVTRAWLTVPAIGNEVEIELQVTHASETVLAMRVVDDLSPGLSPLAVMHSLTAYPREGSCVRYSIVPAERGEHRAGRVYLRYRSAIGLAERWAAAELEQTIRVYPRLRAGDEHDLFLARSRQVEMQRRKEQLRGQGREFESLREYREGGDDLREVCWTATARCGTLICRQYQVERSQPVWLVLDSGRMLQMRSGDYCGLDYTTSAALGVAKLALLSGDRVGLMGYGQAVQQRVMLGRGKTHFRHLMDATALLRAETGEAGHLAAAAVLARMQPTRSLIVWFTDFAETAMRPEVIDGAFQLMRRHLLLFVVPAPEEMMELVAERPQNVTVMYERTAAQEMLLHRELLLARLRNRGALTIQTPFAQISGAALNRYLEIKEASLL